MGGNNSKKKRMKGMSEGLGKVWNLTISESIGFMVSGHILIFGDILITSRAVTVVYVALLRF